MSPRKLSWSPCWAGTIFGNPFTCLSLPCPPRRAEQIGQFCFCLYTPLSPAPPAALPQAPMFCVVFISSLLTWGGRGEAALCEWETSVAGGKQGEGPAAGALG